MYIYIYIYETFRVGCVFACKFVPSPHDLHEIFSKDECFDKNIVFSLSFLKPQQICGGLPYLHEI